MSGPQSLDPRPAGWFAVALSAELAPGQERSGILCAAPYRLHRQRDGQLRYVGSIGAVAEQNGYILAWHHPFAQPPDWQVPCLDETGWRPLRHHQLRARSHPQETYENSIDLAHFPVVHGFTELTVLQAPTFSDNSMSVRYRIARTHPLPLLPRIRPSFEVRLHGLGCAHNHIEVPVAGLRVRMFAQSTPTEPGWVDIRLGVSIRANGRLPGVLLPWIHRGIMHNVVHDFCQDIAIWENKQYRAPPLLVSEDGPIGSFRQWCRRYYPATVGRAD